MCAGANRETEEKCGCSDEAFKASRGNYFWYPHSSRNMRTGNSDNSMKASDPRNAFYWRFVELGTVNMPAHPFIRPAFDTTEELAAQVAIQRMNQAIDEV